MTTLVAAEKPLRFDAIDRAVDLLRDAEIRSEQSSRDWADVAWQRYLDYLLRGDTLSDEEVSNLASLLRDLEISPADVAEDRNTINRALDYVGQHDDLAEVADAVGVARKKRDEVRRRCDEELRTANHDLLGATQRLGTSKTAASKLIQLAKQRPQFFTAGDAHEPPRLRPHVSDNIALAAE